MADFVFPDFGGLSETELAPDIDVSESVFESLEVVEIPYGLTWEFDFTNGDIALNDGGKPVEVTEQATLREWISHTLMTARGETPIFSDSIGTDIYEMIGQTHALDGHNLARIERQISAAILVHDRIAEVEKIAIIPLGYNVYVYLKFRTTDSAEFNELIAL